MKTTTITNPIELTPAELEWLTSRGLFDNAEEITL